MTKYFETEIPMPFKKGQQVKVYCKATLNEDGWTVAVCHTDSSTPFLTVMNGVQENFFKGAEEITQSFYHQQISFIGNLCS